VNGTTVVADKSTKFTGGKCDKLKNGDDVSVTGVVSSGTVSASEIHKQ